MCVVSTEVPFINFARRVAHAVWATKPGLFVYYMVIVEPDVDPTNMDEVLHAITTKCHPVNGIHHVPHIPGFPVLLPFLRAERTADRRCRRRDLRLHLAEGLAEGEHSGEGDF